MATLTRAEMINKVLQRLGVLGAGQSATGEDAALVGPIVDTVHTNLRARGMAPYATSAFPSYAQEPFAQIACYHAGPYFGMRLPSTEVDAGESELVKQLRTHAKGNPVKAKFY